MKSVTEVTKINNERQLKLMDEDILLPTIQVNLDHIDRVILDIFLRHPSWRYKVQQINYILEYQNISIKPMEIAKRLDFFVRISVLKKEKGSRVYIYSMIK